MISYLGDFKEDATIYIMFNTFTSNNPSASCTITNFINTDVHIHKDDGLGQRNNAAGITVSVDFDGITGSHMIKIDTSDNTVAGFWVVGHEYFVRIEGTTIDGATINSVVGQFSIENRFNEVDVVKWLGTAAATPTVAGVPETDITHIGGVAQSATDLKDMVDTGYDPNTHKIQSDLVYIHGSALTETSAGYLAAAFIKLFDVVTPLLVASDVMRGTDLAALATTALTDVTWTDAKAAFLDHSITTVDTVVDGIQTDLDNATDGLGALKALIDTVDGIVDDILLDTGTNGVVVASGSKTGYALSATGANLILKNSTFALAIADAIWDEILSGATHNISGSAGRRIREIGAFAIHSGTAQAGATQSITLAATADANDGIYNRNLIVLVDNTGNGQTRTIVDYNGTTKVAIVDREWRVTPDATTEYQITPDDTPLVVDHGVAQAGTSTTITLRAYASSIDDNYLCNIITIIAGTGRGQARLVGSYVGSTKVVTICGDNWVTTPDTTSVYTMIPYGAACASCMGTTALSQIKTEVDAALNTAIPGSPTADSINERIIAIDDLTQASGSGDLAAIKVKTDNLPSGPAKNVALPKFDFLMVLSSDGVTGATGKTVTGEISKDGTSFAALTNSITEVSDGMYVMLSGLTQAEMNADILTLKFSATDCLNRIITVHTT